MLLEKQSDALASLLEEKENSLKFISITTPDFDKIQIIKRNIEKFRKGGLPNSIEEFELLKKEIDALPVNPPKNNDDLTLTIN